MSRLSIRMSGFALLVLLSTFRCVSGSTITIEVQNTQLVAGGTGYVDVYLTGLGAATLGRFQYEFVVVGVGPGIDTVNFRHVPASEVQGVSLPNPYVFYGDSDETYYQSEPDSFDPTHVLGSDILGNLNIDQVDVEGKFLLARLEVEHFGDSGRDFIISLVAANSLFDRDALLDTDNNYGPGEINAVSGTLKIVATPEPATLGLLALVIGGGAAWRKKKMKCPT